MENKAQLIGISIVVVVLAACVWWVMSATPTDTDIEAAAQQPPALPRINLQQLDSHATAGRTIHGTLPITVDDSQLGRTDPFAGT